MLTNILQNPWTVAIVGGLIVVLVGYFIFGIGKPHIKSAIAFRNQYTEFILNFDEQRIDVNTRFRLENVGDTLIKSLTWQSSITNNQQKNTKILSVVDWQPSEKKEVEEKFAIPLNEQQFNSFKRLYVDERNVERARSSLKNIVEGNIDLEVDIQYEDGFGRNARLIKSLRFDFIEGNWIERAK